MIFFREFHFVLQPEAVVYSDPVNHHKEFLALYAGHHGWLLSWLNRKLGDSFLASDLAQDSAPNRVRDILALLQREIHFTIKVDKSGTIILL